MVDSCGGLGDSMTSLLTREFNVSGDTHTEHAPSDRTLVSKSVSLLEFCGDVTFTVISGDSATLCGGDDRVASRLRGDNGSSRFGSGDKYSLWCDW